MISDGCSGFWLFEIFFHITACCTGHDLGQTDGWLLDCLLNNTPHWAWPFVGFCVALMILLRPIWNVVKRLWRRN